MGRADRAAAYHQVAEIPCVEATVRDGIHIRQMDKRICLYVPALQASHRVPVNRPAPVGHRVLKPPGLQKVRFLQDVISHNSPALPFARQEADPVQRIVLRPVVSAVFDVVPYAVNDLEELIADLLIVFNDLFVRSAELKPPIAGFELLMSPVMQLLLRIGVGPLRFYKGNRPAQIDSSKHDRASEGHIVAPGWRQVLTEHLPPFSSNHVLCAGQGGKHSVSSTVHKNFA